MPQTLPSCCGAKLLQLLGLTVSASIPVAVISITLFRLLSKVGLRDATNLEHNIVRTAGSAGESIAFGLGVTMPAIMILGFDLELTRVVLVAVLGGRRALIVQQHGVLKYPEGTACAEVLKAGASVESRMAASPSAKREQASLGGAATSAATIFTGFGIGLAYKTLTEAQLTAAGDKSPGVLLASGYIAGGAIAGIVIAFMAGIMGDFTERITAWSTLHNPFFAGPRADFLSMIPFILLVCCYISSDAKPSSAQDISGEVVLT